MDLRIACGFPHPLADALRGLSVQSDPWDIEIFMLEGLIVPGVTSLIGIFQQQSERIIAMKPISFHFAFKSVVTSLGLRHVKIRKV
jgi:hypothetical protein